MTFELCAIIKSMNEQSIKKLVTYFKERPDVVFAYLFGSRAKGEARASSDWDIAVYVSPLSTRSIEWEEIDREYPQEAEICGDIVKLLATDNVDMLILNRAPAGIAASALRGTPLVIKDRRIWLKFMLAVTNMAEEYQQFAHGVYEVAQRSKSLSPEDRESLERDIQFIEEQIRLYPVYRQFTLREFENEPRKRNEIERWIENIVNAVVDISKIIVGSAKRPIPQTYRDAVGQAVRDFSLEVVVAEKLEEAVKLRNVLAHEYIDIKWKRISDFAVTSEPYVQGFVDGVKKRLAEKK